MTPNYIADQNMFKLAGPPSWFLRRLWDFDESLVVVPSRQGFYYRLAQRRKLNLPERIVNEALFQHSDTQMLATYSLVPVTTIMATVNWDNPQIFDQLRQMAPHRMGGAEKVINSIEDAEWKAELAKRAETDDMLGRVAKDGWNLYKKKLGLQSHMYIPKRKTEPSQPSLSPAIIIP